MHEISFARNLWTIIQQKAAEKKLKKITTIKISVGRASGIDEHFLEHSFVDHIFPGTIAQEATLEFIKTAPALVCNKCGKVITSRDLLQDECPYCGSTELAINSGKEVKVLEVS